MTFEEAQKFLNTLKREELQDHAFGDAEVYWMDGDKEKAFGYFGGRNPGLSIYDDDGETIASFDGKEAYELRRCGASFDVERNDMTGPERYQEGSCLPGLTLEGVRKELCGK